MMVANVFYLCLLNSQNHCFTLVLNPMKASIKMAKNEQGLKLLTQALRLSGIGTFQ